MSQDQRRHIFADNLGTLLSQPQSLVVGENFLMLSRASTDTNQSQTNAVFTAKWSKYDQTDDKLKLYDMQKRWYLSLYGFASEEELGLYLRRHRVIFDAGCGLGYKAAWFAELAPDSLVIGMDFSEAARQAAEHYRHLDNLFFMQGDIALTPFLSGAIDYVSCDQVIMHTEDPDATFAELARITEPTAGEFACYFYAKKALPRELLDDHFRLRCKDMTEEELWEMSAQLAELGKRLSELAVRFEAPDIPALGIKGGTYDLQRFIYWNFIKCFWNAELGRDTSIVTNFDWYSPSNARRYSETEVRDLVDRNGLAVVHFHREEACYSGRFAKASR